MRISDWSSDVCSSDLRPVAREFGQIARPAEPRRTTDDAQPHENEKQRETDREDPEQMGIVHGATPPSLAMVRPTRLASRNRRHSARHDENAREDRYVSRDTQRREREDYTTRNRTRMAH